MPGLLDNALGTVANMFSGPSWIQQAQALKDARVARGDQYSLKPTNDEIGLATGMVGPATIGSAGLLGKELGTMRRLPSSASLNTPPAPAAADMARASRVENVPLSSVRGTQSKMSWDKFNSGDHPAPLLEEYADKPVAVRKENGEYLVFDGHHRAVQAINNDQPYMNMHVIDAKHYAPEFAGHKPARPTMSDDELLKQLFGP